mmetsp:Transcript_159408/g.487769  ORF Transcript_159408/g.487769 Transcript_159408/m.487769 type:complete len:389 (-) Transcript_159408:659-1825(-)
MGPRHLHEVGVHVVDADVAAVEEEALPDPHHLLPLVVHHRNLDRQVVPLDRLQVHVGHVKGAVAVEEDGQGVGIGHLRADCEGEAHAHHAQAAAGDHAPRLRPPHELGGHHLMVPHASANENVSVVHHALLVEESVGSLNDLLRLDHAVRGLDVAEGVVFLPLLALRLPLLPCGVLRRLDEPLHGLEGMLCVGPDGHGGLHHLPEGSLVDVDVDDAARALPLRHPRLRGVLVHDAGGAVIETAPYGYDAVRVLDGKVGVRGSVHAQHVHGQRVPLVEDAHAMDGGCDGDLRLGRDSPQDVWAVGRALAHIEDGALGLVDDLCRPLDALHVHHGWGVDRGQRGLPKDGRRDLRPRGHNVLRQVYVARARAAGAGDAEGLVDSPRQLVEV